MKKILIALGLLVCFTTMAQHPRKTHTEKPNFTPEQIATLKVKELTLMLDLSENQQAKINILEFAAATDRKAHFEDKELKEGMTDEEHFNNRNEMLDKRIAFKDSMKSILTEEQFQKWKKSFKTKGMKRHHKSHHRKKSEKK